MTYKTIWLSDLHLGTRGADAAGALAFLRQHESETLYLVGGIVDFWHLRRDRYWPQAHNDVLQKILRKARKGTRVVYLPGNHDEFSAQFLGVYGNVIVKEHELYTSVRGQRLLVIHGHQFDMVTKHARWMALLGDAGYSLLLRLNRPLNALRGRYGLSHWSLSAYVKSRVKSAVNFVSQFEDAVVHFAELHRADGIVCGHIHTPTIKQIRHITYYNCGDWVESHTAMVEHADGRIELWPGPPNESALPMDADSGTGVSPVRSEISGE